MADIPVEVVFAPNWWFRNYGISFDRAFYFDHDARIANDLKMRRAFWDRFGLGAEPRDPRPIIGSEFVAGGFVVPALLGVEIRFAEEQAPWPVPANLARDQAMALRVPDVRTTWPMSEWIADMDRLEREFGYVVGDFNTDGILNTALQLRGQQFFLDLIEDDELAHHLCSVIFETQCRVAEFMRARTGTCSVSVNRSICNFDPRLYVHANCSAQMISPALFARTLLGWECQLADRLAPYGIHHCGSNLHLFAPHYALTGAAWYDVGWGSRIDRCLEPLAGAFLNLRLSPVRMLECTAAEIRADATSLLAAAGRCDRIGLCAINLDHSTPDANVEAMFQAAR